MYIPTTTTVPIPSVTITTGLSYAMPQRWNFCPSDGQKLESNWNNCPKCGAQIPGLSLSQTFYTGDLIQGGPSLTGEPCMFDGLKDGVYGLSCPCPKCTPRC